MRCLQPLLYLTLTALTVGCGYEDHDFESWEVYKGDAASTSYSSISQIDTDNVIDLELAWEFKPGDAAQGSRFSKYECNPIVVDGVMYLTSAQRWLYAIDPGRGEKLWSFDPFEGEKGGGICRGVSYWSDGDESRILFTADHFLYAVAAETGELISSFGSAGKIDLNENLGVNPDSIWVIPTSPGIVYEDLLIIGGEVSETHGAAPGHIRAYDIRSGALIWTFRTIPHPGEYGYETWPPDAWKYVGGANNWGGMSLDEERGIVYAPLGSPTYDFYGADRKGMNLFGNALVALDAATGERIWHFQTVHHDVWDYDLPAPPTLLTVQKNGKDIDAVALPAKTGFLYVFDRLTGEPLFPIEERPVPASRVPGEEVWPTQPFPTLPKAYTRQSISVEDLTNRTEQARIDALTQFERFRFEGLFTPPDPDGTIMIPGTRGGSEWGGVAADPLDGIIYVNANESPEIAQVQKVGASSAGSPYARGAELYKVYCASCHGTEMEGQSPLYPAIAGIGQRLESKEIESKILKGAGRMPSFAHLSERQIRSILAFILESDGDEMLKQHDMPELEEGNYTNITAYSYFRDSDKYPAIKPPWGTMHAINLNSGSFLWSIPLGDKPDAREADDPLTGTENYGGPIVTAGGLLFIAATNDHKIRAFNKKTGDLLWEYTLPASGFASPSTYLHEGRQFIVICVSGTSEYPDGSVVAFALPE